MILKDKNSGKILRSASGEILTQSDALIDLRSTYGVTKNVSNEVEKAKLVNIPMAFRPRIGNEVVVDGDGFDFATNVNGDINCNIPEFNIADDFFIGFWSKFKTDPLSREMVICGCYASGSPAMYCSIANSGSLKISLSGGITTGEGFVRVDPPLTDWNYFSLERVSGVLHVCKNGLYSDSIVSTDAMKSNGNKMEIANIGGVHDFNEFDGKLDDLLILPKSLHNYSGKVYLEEVFTPPKRSSE